MKSVNQDRVSPPGQRADVRITFQPNGRQGSVPVGTNLLDAARKLGVEIESICGGNQTCGKCKILVEEGEFAKFGVNSRASHLTPAEERESRYAERRQLQPNERLSCACQVLGDLVIHVPAESQIRKQVVRKSISVDKPITVDAAVRLYYVELPLAALKDHRGDAERLKDQLREVHGLTDIRFDPLVLRDLQPALQQHNRSVTVSIWQDDEIVQIRPGFHDELYGVAVDIGTTTVAAHLCNLRTGHVLATASRMNPQVSFGEDLMSRVSYAMMHEDGTERMHRALVDGLNELLEELSQTSQIHPVDIIEMVAVANTTMHHLLLGVSPIELGGAPFSLVIHDAVDMKARDLGLTMAPGANLHIPPCEAGHVGADNVAVLMAEAPYLQDSEQQLVIDIGTNGEILLGNRTKMLSASSPTGPAFEGAQIVHGMRAAPGAIERVRVDPAALSVRYKLIGREEWMTSLQLAAELRDSMPSQTGFQPGGLGENGHHLKGRQKRQARRDELLNPPLLASGICGSGIIEAVAELFMAGIVAPNGRIVDIDHPRLRKGLGEGGGKAEFILAWPHETSTGAAITVHSDDIRAIQLAKAALYAGSKLLMKRLGLDSVDRIKLAGGFGSYIDPNHAMILGLIPDCALDKIEAVGNAAGDGARILLLDKEKRAEAKWAARWVTYVETAVEPSFQAEFVDSIDIPHASDPFPHLQKQLAEARSRWDTQRQEAIQSIMGDGRRQRASREERAARRSRRNARS